MKAIVALAVCVSAVICASASPSEQKSKNCNEVRTAYSSKGFNSNDVPNKGVYGKTPLSAFLIQLRGLSNTTRFCDLTLNTFITLYLDYNERGGYNI